jgi:hypothetical protein
MKVLISILGDLTEESLKSATSQNYDVININTKPTNLDCETIIVDENELLSTAIKYANKHNYDFMYIMHPKTQLLENAIHIFLDTIKNECGIFTDYVSISCQEIRNRRIVYLQSLIDNQIDLGYNVFINVRDYANLNIKTINDLVLKTNKIFYHIPTPTYSIMWEK